MYSCDRDIYNLAISLCVSDSVKLWDSACRSLMQVGTVDLDEIVDLLGPREAPSIEDCIVTLFDLGSSQGCLPIDFSLEISRKECSLWQKRLSGGADMRPRLPAECKASELLNAQPQN